LGERGCRTRLGEYGQRRKVSGKLRKKGHRNKDLGEKRLENKARETRTRDKGQGSRSQEKR
jgi:hypothetical protein